jgi:hypothetical protein
MTAFAYWLVATVVLTATLGLPMLAMLDRARVR